MAQSLKFLSCKHGDLSSTPRIPIKQLKPARQVEHTLSTQEVDEAHWPVRPAKSVSSTRVDERSWL